MRKIFTLSSALLVLSALGLAMTGCSEKTNEQITDVIVLSRNIIPFATDGGASAVSIASLSAWTPSCQESWVTLTPAEGALTISVSKNTTSQIRKATITVTSQVDEKTISIEQAFSQQTVSLTVVAPENLSLDSEEDNIIISVITNGEWSVESKTGWLTATPDFERNTIALTTQPNDTGSSRPGTISVTSTLGGSTKSKEVTVRQIDHSENPYYNLLGNYGLYAKKWYINGITIEDVEPVQVYCTIEQDEYRKSFRIKNLFATGTDILATYDRENNKINIELGTVCMTNTQWGAGITMYYYLVRVNTEVSGFTGGLFSGLSERIELDGQEADVITFAGFDVKYPGLGMIGRRSDDLSINSFGDLPYAITQPKAGQSGDDIIYEEMYLVKGKMPSNPAGSAVGKPADKLLPFKSLNQ